MKLLISALLLILASTTSAQEPRFVQGEGIESHFKNCIEGYFPGQVNEKLNLTKASGENIDFLFVNKPAMLQIKPDSNEIYDVSFKYYEFLSNDINLEYETYASANSIRIELDDQEYSFSLIDGSCEARINGIDYQFTDNIEDEIMELRFSKDVNLYTDCSYQKPELVVKKKAL